MCFQLFCTAKQSCIVFYTITIASTFSHTGIATCFFLSRLLNSLTLSLSLSFSFSLTHSHSLLVFSIPLGCVYERERGRLLSSCFSVYIAGPCDTAPRRPPLASGASCGLLVGIQALWSLCRLAWPFLHGRPAWRPLSLALSLPLAHTLCFSRSLIWSAMWIFFPSLTRSPRSSQCLDTYASALFAVTEASVFVYFMNRDS